MAFSTTSKPSATVPARFEDTHVSQATEQREEDVLLGERTIASLRIIGV